MPWTENMQVAAPERLTDEANRLAYLIDPDVGGDETFTGAATHSKDGSAPATHVVNRTQLQEDTYDLLTTAGPMEIMDHIQTLAEERGREMPGWGASKIETVIEKVEVAAGYELVNEEASV
jgi:hypothetical protein